MIYWLKKLEWKIRKALGIREGRNKTIEDSIKFYIVLLTKLVIFFYVIGIAIRFGEGLARIWWWFFPRIIRGPVRYL